MSKDSWCAIGLWTAAAIGSAVQTQFASAQIDGQSQPPPTVNRMEAIGQFLASHPGNAFVHDDAGRISRVYGPAFAFGPSPEGSAQNFVQSQASLWGIHPQDLAPVGPFADGRHTQPIMFDPATGQPKFTGVYFTQQRDGVPVFGSKLVLLARNEPNAPIVLASADLRDLGTFRVQAGQAGQVNAAAADTNIRRVLGSKAQIAPGEQVIFAGVNDLIVPPTLANKFIATATDPQTGMPLAALFVTDAVTGSILHQESLIYDVDVAGTVTGVATEALGADTCANESPRPLPYVQASIGATSVFADVNGNFVIPNAGSTSVQVSSNVRGQYFNIFNPGSAPSATISTNVLPPGPANLVHNADNSNEFARAEVNAYIHANVVRDYALNFNPAYPVIGGQSGANAMAVNVNINQNCNAFYSPVDQSINFYVAGGACTNTANSTVVYHEYGHHLVQSGGSGQGAYGEGMSDCVAIVVSDSPLLGLGFNAGCGTPLRNAVNACNYVTTGCSSCGSASHTCGQVISGCVWGTRNALAASHPATYRSIISNLTLNSILVHSGSTITPSITVDFLTLDDDNADITDGTPHYNQINAGFSAKAMPAPALAPLKFNYPNGRPDFISPSGGTTMRVEVQSLTANPQPGSAVLHVNTGSGFTTVPMTQISPNIYDAVFPAMACGGQVTYYFSAQTTGAVTVNSPGNAPTSTFSALAGSGLGPIVFTDNFESNLGWTVVNQGAVDGFWERAVPVPTSTCNRGNPGTDGDGSGSCFLTDNSSANACNSDVDDGGSILLSPILNASQGATMVSYWRWFDNTGAGTGSGQGQDTFLVEISSNGGTTWQNLETVGPTGTESDGGWFFKQFSLAAVPGFALTNQFRIRFIAQDLGTGSVVEAAVDAVKLQTLLCANPCPADLNASGTVDVQDLLAVIGAWGATSANPADVNGNGVVNVQDLLAVIGAWGQCP